MKLSVMLWRRASKNSLNEKPAESSQDLLADEFCATEKLARITEIDERDVFLVGYPKSGNTWFQNLVAGVAYGVLPEFAPPSLVQLDLVPDVHKKRLYKRYSTPMFFKSHRLPKPEYRRVVYLIRDGRDVMVSYFHALQARQKAVEFATMVRTGERLFPCKWHEHVAAWLKNPHKADMLLIKYEDLHANAVHELKRFCQFAGVDRSDDFLEMIASSAAFNKLQEREKSMGSAIKRPERQADKLFFRRGVVGSHRDEMPEDVREAFVSEAAEALQAAGYAV